MLKETTSSHWTTGKELIKDIWILLKKCNKITDIMFLHFTDAGLKKINALFSRSRVQKMSKGTADI